MLKVSLDRLCSGKEQVNGWIAEGLVVAWLMALYPWIVLPGPLPRQLRLFLEAGGGRRYEQGRQSALVQVWPAYSLLGSTEACWCEPPRVEKGAHPKSHATHYNMGC